MYTIIPQRIIELTLFVENNPTVLTVTFSTSFLGRTLFIFIIVLRKQTLLETYIPKAKVWSVATQCSACVTCA